MNSGMVKSTPNGVMINIRVIPRAGRSAIAGTRANALLVRLRAPPIEGAANDELIEVLARTFAVPKRSVIIVAGERSRAKQVAVAGITAEDVHSAVKS
jgi:uncharacterized protein (TIGR00251 family)